MNGQFLADPTVIEQNGNKIQGKSEEFKESIQAIYNTVEDMINNDYISKEAVEIGRKIESYHNDMNILAKTIAEYGVFLKRTANAVRNNQEEIIESIH